MSSLGHALLLVGHGSHLSAESSAPVHAHATRIAAMRLYDEVGVAFWKEEPSLSRGLEQFSATDITIVPVFMSEGYFTDEVLPTELGLTDGQRTDCGVTARITPPVGVHPALANVIVQRAWEAGAGPDDAVVVLGHGTRRNSRSEAAIYAQAERVRATNQFAEVVTLFLDQDPNLRDVFALTKAPKVVMVPLFVAEGWHVGETIPEELSLDGSDRREGGRWHRYAEPVGTHPAIADVVLELTGTRRPGLAAVTNEPDDVAASRPLPRWLEERLHFREPFHLGDVRVSFNGPSIRIAPSETDHQALPRTPGELRRLLAHDVAGRYRPLPSAQTMPQTWEATCAPSDTARWLDAIYPLAVREVEMADERTLSITTLDELFARQRGRYRIAADLDDEGREMARGVLCARCVRQPLWADDARLSPPDPSDGTRVAIPCAEPCSVMLSLCREAALWQSDPPAPAAPDEGVPFAAFDEPGNEIREAYLARRYAADHGDR